MNIAPAGVAFSCLDVAFERHIAKRSALVLTGMLQFPRQLDQRTDYLRNETLTQSVSGLALRAGVKRFVYGDIGCGVYFCPAMTLELVRASDSSVRKRRDESQVRFSVCMKGFLAFSLSLYLSFFVPVGLSALVRPCSDALAP